MTLELELVLGAVVVVLGVVAWWRRRRRILRELELAAFVMLAAGMALLLGSADRFAATLEELGDGLTSIVRNVQDGGA